MLGSDQGARQQRTPPRGEVARARRPPALNPTARETPCLGETPAPGAGEPDGDGARRDAGARAADHATPKPRKGRPGSRSKEKPLGVRGQQAA